MYSTSSSLWFFWSSLAAFDFFFSACKHDGFFSAIALQCWHCHTIYIFIYLSPCHPTQVPKLPISQHFNRNIAAKICSYNCSIVSRMYNSDTSNETRETTWFLSKILFSICWKLGMVKIKLTLLVHHYYMNVLICIASSFEFLVKTHRAGHKLVNAIFFMIASSILSIFQLAR